MRSIVLFALLVPCVGAGEMPTGQDSPEGAATDLWKAVLFSDSQLYRRVQNPKLVKNEELATAVALRAKEMEAERRKHIGATADGTETEGVARRAVLLVRSMCAVPTPSAHSTAQKEYQFKRIGVVVVETQLPGPPPKGGLVFDRRRTFVVQDEDGKWYALDRPDLFPNLTEGYQQAEWGKAVWVAAPRSDPHR